MDKQNHSHSRIFEEDLSGTLEIRDALPDEGPGDEKTGESDQLEEAAIKE